MTGPATLADLIDTARRTRDTLAKVTAPPPGPPPEDETAAAGFTRRMREQAEAERRDEALDRRVAFEHPNAPTRADLDDPLRAIARGQRAARRLRRSRRVA